MWKEWWARITSGGVAGTISYFTANLIIPAGIPIMTGIVGWVQGIPWFYLIIGVSFVTATVFHALAKWNEWKSNTKVEHKIGFKTIQFGNDIHGQGIIVTFAIDNLADFPIDFEIYELIVKLEDKVPKKEHKAGQIITMPSKGVGWPFFSCY